MSRNFQACWTCRIRRKGGCQGPGPAGECSICIELNIECLQGYGERVPRDYRRPEIVEELSRWNRRRSSRNAPEKFLLSVLLEQVLAAQNVPGPAPAASSTYNTFHVLTQNASNPSHSPQRDISATPIFLAPMTGVDGFSNPSPTISSKSSSAHSTLSSGAETFQGNPFHENKGFRVTREAPHPHAHAPHQHTQSSAQTNLLSEIASDYTVYLSRLTPSPQISSVAHSQVGTGLSGEIVTSSGSTEARGRSLGTESSNMTHRPAASSSPQTFLRELSSQADSMRFAALTLGDPSNPRSTPPYSKASTSLDPANAQRQVAMQHDRLTSVPMSPAQTVGMAAAAQWEQSPFPVSVWSSVPEEPQSSAGFVGEYGTPASSRALGLNANDAAFLHGSPPFAPHGSWPRGDAATAQYLYLQQARLGQPIDMGSGHRAADPRPSRLAPRPLSSNRRTGPFQEIGSGGSPGSNDQTNS